MLHLEKPELKTSRSFSSHHFHVWYQKNLLLCSLYKRHLQDFSAPTVSKLCQRVKNCLVQLSKIGCSHRLPSGAAVHHISASYCPIFPSSPSASSLRSHQTPAAPPSPHQHHSSAAAFQEQQSFSSADEYLRCTVETHRSSEHAVSITALSTR